MDSFLPFSFVELENADYSPSQTILHLDVHLLWILHSKMDGKTLREDSENISFMKRVHLAYPLGF